MVAIQRSGCHDFRPRPFKQRAAGSTSRPGLGLGLFIVKQIIASHNEDITVESDNRRTVLEVVLPRNANVQQPVQHPPPTQ
ncbi:ATP-binding protein [Caballeronia glebae]|uniref:ATP-binding protein n=1 Tax=Caballeronia glebae TaxID=1777143 RepID=UPI003898EA09